MTIDIRETQGARTAQMAADAVGCDINQIAKSIVFENAETGDVVLFLTAGGRQVDAGKAGALLGAQLRRADAATVRQQTGFAIGGVSPVGHLSPITSFCDETLMAFDEIWAAAGTPNHVFGLSPDNLLHISGATVGDFSV